MSFLPGLVILLVLGYFFYMRARGGGLGAGGMPTNALPAFASFFQRTGYRYPDMPTATPEQSAERALREAQTGGAISRYEYVRDFHGVPVRYKFQSGQSRDELGRAVFWMSNGWSADAAPPRWGLQIADRRLGSVTKTVIDALQNRERVWSARFPHTVPIGVPALDQQLVVYTSDPAAAAQLFATQPQLVQMLSGWAELDVSVDAQGATLSDPEFKNMNAVFGGTMGNMAIGFDMQKRMDLSLPLHDRAAELLATLVRATR